MGMPEVGLIGDIGATNARFALAKPDGSATHVRLYALNDYPSLADAIDAYLAEESPRVWPGQAVLAVAAPVTGDRVTLTNHAWTFSIEALRRHLGLGRLRVINDFSANALAIPHLAEGDRIQIGPGSPVRDAPIGLIGPGTGLGVSALVSAPGGPVAIPGEGGHVTVAPANAHESAILDLMRRRYDHVSAERLLSGPGLVNLYNALCETSQAPAAPFTAAQITNPHIWDEDPRTREATTMFCAMLGTMAGNLALTLGARGGIYVAGGIVPRLGSVFAQSEFRARFEAKGRLRGYLAEIPTYVIVRPLPALLGAAALLSRSSDTS
jgi:glucokinase